LEAINNFLCMIKVGCTIFLLQRQAARNAGIKLWIAYLMFER
jgi:hypothetical protein